MKIIIAVLVLCVSLWGQTLYESPQTQQFCDGQPAIQAALTPFLNQLSGYMQAADGNSAQNLAVSSARRYLHLESSGPATVRARLWWNLVGNTGPLGAGAKVWWVENSGLQGSDATPVSVPFNATGGRMYITISSLAPQTNPNAITTYSFLDCGQGACPANPPVLMSCQIAQAGNGAGQANATHCNAAATFNLVNGDNLIMQATQAGAVSTNTPVWVLLDFSGVS